MSFFIYAIAGGSDVHAQVSKAGMKASMGVGSPRTAGRGGPPAGGPKGQRSFGERAGSILGGIMGAVDGSGSFSATLLPQATEMAMAHLGYLCEVSPVYSYGKSTELHGVVQVTDIKPARPGGIKIPGIVCSPFAMCEACTTPYQTFCHNPGSLCFSMPLNIQVVAHEVRRELLEGRTGAGHNFHADVRAYMETNELALELKRSGLNPADATIISLEDVAEVVPLIG